MHPHDPEAEPLDAADPRISDWIDGRLPPAAAAAVARAVGESPELTALADDLRAIRRCLRRLPEPPPAAGFSDRVMAAIEADSRPAGQADACRPVGRPDPPGERSASLPQAAGGRPAGGLFWKPLAAALAAGLLLAVVINRPRPPDRTAGEVPAGGEQDAWTPAANQVARRQEAGKDFLSDGNEKRVVATDAVAVDAVAVEEVGQAPQLAMAEQAMSLPAEPEMAAAAGSPVPPASALAAAANKRVTAEEAFGEAMILGGGGGGGADRQAGGERLRKAKAAGPEGEPQAPLSDKSDMRSEVRSRSDEAPARQAAALPTAPARPKPPAAGVLVITVASVGERQAIDRLLAASGLEVRPDEGRLELVGSAAVINEFLAGLGQAGLLADVRRLAAERPGGAGRASLVLRIVERRLPPAAADEARP